MSLVQLSMPRIIDKQAEAMQKGQVACSTPNRMDMRKDENVAQAVVAASRAMRLVESNSASSTTLLLLPLSRGDTASPVVMVYAANPKAGRGTSVPSKLMLAYGPSRTEPQPPP